MDLEKQITEVERRLRVVEDKLKTLSVPGGDMNDPRPPVVRDEAMECPSIRRLTMQRT